MWCWTRRSLQFENPLDGDLVRLSFLLFCPAKLNTVFLAGRSRHTVLCEIVSPPLIITLSHTILTPRSDLHSARLLTGGTSPPSATHAQPPQQAVGAHYGPCPAEAIPLAPIGTRWHSLASISIGIPPIPPFTTSTDHNAAHARVIPDPDEVIAVHQSRFFFKLMTRSCRLRLARSSLPWLLKSSAVASRRWSTGRTNSNRGTTRPLSVPAHRRRE